MPDYISQTTFAEFKDSLTSKLDAIHDDTKKTKEILLGNGVLGLVAKVINIEESCRKCDESRKETKAAHEAEHGRIVELCLRVLPYLVGAITAGGAGAGIQFLK